MEMIQVDVVRQPSACISTQLSFLLGIPPCLCAELGREIFFKIKQKNPQELLLEVSFQLQQISRPAFNTRPLNE